jgi:hypothetical protein
MSFYASSWFVELLLFTLYVLLAVTAALAVWSAVRSVVVRSREQGARGKMQGVRRLSMAVAGGVLALTLLLCWLSAGTEPVVVNGRLYADAFWLSVADTLIYASIVLIAVAALCVGFGASGLSRRIMKKQP